jgi:hypothetical protein
VSDGGLVACVAGWLVGLALVCALVCAFVSAFVCSFRGLFACVLSWVEIYKTRTTKCDFAGYMCALLTGCFVDRFLLARHNASDARRRRLTLFLSLRAFGPSRPPATCKRNEPYSSKPSKMTNYIVDESNARDVI